MVLLNIFFNFTNSQNFDFHTQEINAVESVKLQLENQQEPIDIIVSGGRDIGTVVVHQIFDSTREKTLKFQNYLEVVQFILNVPESNHVLIFFNSQFILVDLEHYLKQIQHGETLTITDTEKIIQKSITGNSLISPPSIAFKNIFNDSDEIIKKEYLGCFVGNVGPFFIKMELENKEISSVVIEQVPGTQPTIKSVDVFLFGVQEFSLAFGYADSFVRLYFTSNLLESREIDLRSGEPIIAIKKIEDQLLIMAADISGKLFKIEAPLPIVNIIVMQNLALRGEYNIMQEEGVVTANPISRISHIKDTNYVILTGESPKFKIFDFIEEEVLQDIKAADSNFIKYCHVQIKNTPYIVVKQYQTSVSNFQRKYTILDYCPENFQKVGFQGCVDINSVDKENLTPEGQIKPEYCGNWGYFDGQKCQRCSLDCDQCENETYYNIYLEKELNCYTCSAYEGQCVCRQNKECEENQFWDSENCQCSKCSITKDDCSLTNIFNPLTCECEARDFSKINCIENLYCEKCSTNSDEEKQQCVECADKLMSPPECVCELGQYFNEDQCSRCPQEDCAICTGENGEECWELEDNGKLGLAYSMQILIGVGVVYIVAFGSMFGLKIVKKSLMEINSGNSQHKKIKQTNTRSFEERKDRVHPEEADQTDQQLIEKASQNNKNQDDILEEKLPLDKTLTPIQ